MPEYIVYNPVDGYITEKYFSVDPGIVAGKSNLLEITRDVYNSLTEYHIVKDKIVRLMTNEEKTIWDNLKAQTLIDIENTKINNLDNLINNVSLGDLTLIKVDTKIDNVANLADAKIFLKLLVRYLVKYAQNIP